MSLREIWKDKLTEGYTVFTAWMIQYYKDNQLKNGRFNDILTKFQEVFGFRN